MAQSRQLLERQRFEIVQEIDKTNKLLKETEKNQKIIFSDLSIIQSQINNRKKLLDQIQKEIDFIDSHSDEKQNNIALLQNELDSLNNQSNIILRSALREKLQRDPIVSFLSIKSMGESFLKMSYYNRLKSFIDLKLQRVSGTTMEIEKEIADLTKEKEQKKNALIEIEKQSELLSNEEDKQRVLISSLKTDEEALKTALKQQLRERESKNIAIENIIKSRFGEESNSFSTADVVSLSSMKGKLKWPVEDGIISAKYGKQRHPTLTNLTIVNNGIDIRAALGSQVLAVASGQVVSVSKLAGYGRMIIVNHQEYYSVYSKLEEVFVKKGDVINEGKLLGTLLVRNNSSELHFEIWKGDKTLNPQSWLKK